MKKAFVFLALAVSAPSFAQAPDMFKDQDPMHWAYAAMESLRSKGIVIGYPDGYFRGKRTLTRYEFAVALDRALKQFMPVAGQKGEQGPRGEAGPQGPTGPGGPPGMTPEEVANLRRLTQEFKDELAALGRDMAAVSRRIDQLAKDVADLKSVIDKLPVIGGDGFVGVRSNNSNGVFVDYDGRVTPLGTSRSGIDGAGGRGYPSYSGSTSGQAVVHSFRLTLDANIAGGAKFNAGLVMDNYKSFLGGSFSEIRPLQGSAVAADTYLQTLTIKTPAPGIGRGSGLTLGRYPFHMSRLSFYRPDNDRLFDLPWLDNGNWYLDGGKLDIRRGRTFFTLFGGQTASIQGTRDGPYMIPFAGASPNVDLFNSNQKPIGAGYTGQIGIEQMMGLMGGYNLGRHQSNYFGFTAYDTSTKSSSSYGGPAFHEVYVLGTWVNYYFNSQFSTYLDFGKTITHNGPNHYVGTHQNSAFWGDLNYKSGALNATAGYRYIDPLFYAPGYWGHIGNWVNPTNVQGPAFRASYDLCPQFGVNVGGDFYKGARNRAGVGGLGTDDEITRVLAGLSWNLSKTFQTTVDWEGNYWKLDGVHFGIPAMGAGTIHPTEHYVTLGTGYHLTDSTLLKIKYQIGDFNGHNALQGGPGSAFNRYNFNTFIGEVNVHF